jgi:gliding motility-associated-like protein
MITTLLRRAGLLAGLALCLVLGTAHPVAATHLLGGEMTYRYLDADGPAAAPLRYELTVTVYNNCGSAGIFAPRGAANVSIYDQATGSRITLTQLNSPFARGSLLSIPVTSISDCISPPIPPGCTITGVSQPYRLQKFVAVINLPASSSGYYALFTDNARNADVTNLLSPSSQDMTLYVSMSPPSIPNHSPVFSDIAVAIICANDTTMLLNNAVDADGDRLVYTFGQPYALPVSLNSYSYFSPPPPTADYNAGFGYSATAPLGTAAGNFAFLDPTTGLATYKATDVGRKYAVAVDVQEYRVINGREQLIGTTRRDLQLVVALCPPARAPAVPPSIIPRDYTVEAGSTLTIPITSSQADNHPLDLTLNSVLLDGAGGHEAAFNGDPGTVLPGNPTGTATVASPTGTVGGTFVFATTCAEARTTPYDVVFTVKDKGCAGKTVSDVLHIKVLKPAGPQRITGDQLVCSLNALRTYTAVGNTAPKLSWRVVGGTIVGSSTGSTVQVQWGGAGTGTLAVRGITQYGCLTDSVVQQVTVSQVGTLAVTGKLSTCRGSSTMLTVAGGLTPYTVTDGTTTVSGPGPFALSPAQTTTYTITGATSPTNCGATTQATVTVLPLPAANAGALTRSICSGIPITLGANAVGGNSYSWSPDTGLSSATSANPTLTLTNTTGAPLTQAYTLTETSAAGCQASQTVVVTVNPASLALTGPAVATCSGVPARLGTAAAAGTTYRWSPATGLSSSTVANPTVTLTNTSGTPLIQAYTLTATNATGCVGTATVVVTVNSLPVATAGAAVAFCSGGSAQLGTAAVAGTTYSWSPVTGLSSSTIANPTITLTNTSGAPVTQIYTLTATNAAGCPATATVAVTANPAAVAVAGPAATLCSGASAQLGTVAVAGTTYSWSPATGLSNSTVANPTITLTNTTGTPLAQTYTLTATNATGCVSTATVAVTVNSVVMPGAISGAQTVCLGTSPAALASTAGASGGTGTYAYQWESSADKANWQETEAATGATYAPGPVTATAYYRRRVKSGACGVFYSNVVAVQAQTPLVATVALATPPTQCAGTALTFSPVPANAGVAPTYRWFVNNTLVASTPTFSSSMLADGDQVRVELTPTAGFCASGPAQATVAVARTPVAQPAVTITLQTVLPVCIGAPLTFSVDKVANPGPAPAYQWQVDGVDVAGAQSPVFTSTTLRDGQLVTLNLRTATVCGPVTVASNKRRATLNPPLDVEAGPDKEIMVGEEVVLDGRASGSYPVAWVPTVGLTFRNGDILHPLAAPLVTTTYTLSAGVGTCADSSPVTVTVRPRLRIPNAISPNGDGENDTWQIDYLGDYPTNHVLVFNRWGNKVFETSGYSRRSEWNGTANGQPVAVGTYYYVITLGNGRSYSGPLTVVY